jgi:hypothetical protein
MRKLCVIRLLMGSCGFVSVLFTVPPWASAKTFSYQSTASTTGVQVPVDLDGNNCGLVNGVTTCPADSVLGTSAGTSRGAGPDTGPFTDQTLVETASAPGTGCSFAPSSQQGCTIGSVTDGCLYNYVGGNGITRNTATGDLAIYTFTSGTLCINFDSGLPFSFEGQLQATFTGGTGSLVNATGSFTSTFHGQILQNDPQGHGLVWDTDTTKGTITLP